MQKIKQKVKQHPQAEISLLKFFGFPHQRYHPKIIRYSKKWTKKQMRMF